jgi:trk system potassium uptake protein TrkH
VKQKGTEVNLFHRSIAREAVSKAIGVCCTAFGIMFISTVLLAAVTDADALDLIYETVSATATVGLTRNLTPQLNTLGKLIITTTMYLGRVGPISLMIAFNFRKRRPNIIHNPVEKISVG